MEEAQRIAKQIDEKRKAEDSDYSFEKVMSNKATINGGPPVPFDLPAPATTNPKDLLDSLEKQETKRRFDRLENAQRESELREHLQELKK